MNKSTIILTVVTLAIIGRILAAVPYVYCDEFCSSSFEYDPVGVGITEPYWECTYKEPAYIEPVDIGGNKAAKCWWSAAGYDGSRLDRGMEACSGNSTSELRFREDGWYGLRIRVPSGDYPTDKNCIVLQLFAHGRGGSWTGTLEIENNKLKIVHRSWLTTNHTVYELDADIARDTWIPIIIYWKPSTNPAIGKMMVWYDGAPKNSPSYDYTGKVGFDAISDGNGGWLDGWVDEDTMISGIGLKWGMYCADAANYTLNETRTLYYDDVTQLKGNPVGAWDLVNPEADGRNALVRMDAEYTSEQSGTLMETCTDVNGGLNLTGIQNGDWSAYYDVNFGAGAQFFEARVASGTSGGNIEVRLDSLTGQLLGTCPVENTGGTQNWVTKSVGIPTVSGLHRIYLKFTGGSGNLLNLNSFKFRKTAFVRTEAESRVEQSGTGLETTGDVEGGVQNVSIISRGDWCRYDNVTLGANAIMNFRVARPVNKPDSRVEVRLGSPTGTLLGSVEVPFTGGWQTYQTVQTTLAPVTGTHSVYLVFVLADSANTSTTSLFNLNWFEFYAPGIPGDLTASVMSASQIDVSWSPIANADSYRLMRSTSSGGPFVEIATGLTSTSYSDSDVVAGTAYFYSVGAVYGVDESGGSTESTAIPSDPIIAEEVVVGSVSVTDNGTGGENVTITVSQSSAGCFYQLEASTDLASSNWEKLGNELLGDGGEVVLQTPVDPEDGRRFYRVVVSRR